MLNLSGKSRHVPTALIAVFWIMCVVGCSPDPQKAHELLESGDFLGARRIYSRMVETNPRSFVGHYGLGMSWSAEAIHRTELGLGEAKDWYPAIYHVGIAVNLGDRNQVRQTLAVLHYNLGIRYRSMGDTSAAIQRIEQAVVYDSTLLKALNLLGAMYHVRGDLDNAERNYRRAVAVRSDYAMAHFNLGALSWARGDMMAAGAYFNAALELEPANSHFRTWYDKAVARTVNRP